MASRRVQLKASEILNIFVKIDDESTPPPKDPTNPFKIVVNTGRSFTIKLNPNYDYNYDVDCDDDGIYETTSRTSEYVCKYKESRTHTIAILGDYPFPQFSGNSAIVAIKQWGDIVWKSMAFAFYNTPNLKTIETDAAPDLSNVKSLEFMFAKMNNFNADLSQWDVSNVISMEGMFYENQNFNGDISNWDVSSVTNMSFMFCDAYVFNGDLSSWNTSSVTDMRYMFFYAIAFNSDLSNWDVSSVTNMQAMFFYATAFNSDISNWEVSNVTDMSYMFYLASAFSNNNLSDWDVSNVTNHQNFSDYWGSGNTEPK